MINPASHFNHDSLFFDVVPSTSLHQPITITNETATPNQVSSPPPPPNLPPPSNKIKLKYRINQKQPKRNPRQQRHNQVAPKRSHAFPPFSLGHTHQTPIAARRFE